MKVSYVFADGSVSEVEVLQEIGDFIVDSRRVESNYDRKCRYHNYSMDAIDYEGLEYADPDTPEGVLTDQEDALLEALYIEGSREGLKTLTETERRRFLMFAEGLSYSEIGRREGVSGHAPIKKSVLAAQKKLRIFLEKWVSNHGTVSP